MVSGEHSDLRARVKGHEAATVANIDHVGHVIDDHDDGGARARPFRPDLLARHGLLGARLCHLDEVDEAALALFEATDDGFVWELREVLVLDDKVVKIVTQVVCTGCTAVSIEDTKEAYLWPFCSDVCLALRLEDVQDDGNAILIVVSNDALIGIGCVGFDHAALFLRGLRWLVILQKERLRIQNGRILSEE